MSWRDTQLPIKFFLWDARMLVGWLVLIGAPYVWVFYPVVMMTIYFIATNFFGLSVGESLKLIRSKLAGRRRGHARSAYRRLSDLGTKTVLALALGASLATLPTDTMAGFQYVSPSGAKGQSTLVRPESLAAAINRIIPNKYHILYDKTVDPTRPAGRFVPGTTFEDSAKSLLWAHGYTFHIEGDEVWVMPRGLQLENFEPTLAGTANIVWEIRADETLQATLERWSERVGVRVIKLTDRVWTHKNDVMFSGTFVEVVDRLFFGLAHLPEAPIYEFSEDGKVLNILQVTQK